MIALFVRPGKAATVTTPSRQTSRPAPRRLRRRTGNIAKAAAGATLHHPTRDRAHDVRLTRQITISLLLGAAITFGTVGLLTLWMVHRIDLQAAEGVRKLLEVAGRSTRNEMALRTIDYGWWDEEYRAYLRGDQAWLDENVGTAAEGTRVIDTIAILGPDGTLDYGWSLPELPPVQEAMSPALVESVFLALHDAPLDPTGARTFIAKTDGSLILAGAARISPTDGSVLDPTTLPVIVLATYFTPERLRRYGHDYFTPDLALTEAPAPGKDSLPLTDLRGATIGYLTWTAPTPGSNVLAEIALPLAAAMLLFASILAMIASRAYRLAKALSQSARHDYLTGLDNRQGLSQSLEQPPLQAALARGAVAAIFVDIDDFKRVNDTVGHRGGDAAIRTFADRLRSVLPPASRITRMGGNGYLALLVGADAGDVAASAERVQRALTEPCLAGGVEFQLGAAVGYATAEPGMDAETLIDRADTAMYAAKRLKPGQPVAYHASMETDAARRTLIEAQLRNAMAQNELRVAYQPIVRLDDMTLDSIEALVRWRSPELGDVAPDQFIPVAEQSGLIRELGDFVVGRVCEDLRLWPGVKVSVNVSPAQLLDEQFVPRVETILAQNRCAPQSIGIELTETVLLQDPPVAARRLRQLREKGVSVSLDDFGVGYASIGSLRSFAIDRLKIDQSFVTGIATSQTDRQLLKAFLDIAGAIGVPVVCEGIETAAQVAIIRDYGCQLGQGYLFSAPLERGEVAARFEAGWKFPENGTPSGASESARPGA